jgi:NTF2-related export protein 1/2
MADPTEDIQTKVADSGKAPATACLGNLLIFLAAEQFVETYYRSLNTPNGQKHLTEFYIKPSPDAPSEADIILNGNTISNPAELQAVFENQVGKCLYEAQSIDCQVLNTNYNVGIDEANLGTNKDGKKMSIMVMVSGSVKYIKDGTEGEIRGFTENFMLVPNTEAHGPKAARGTKKWLIQSQNFRLVL